MLISAEKRSISPLLSINNHQKLRKDSTIQYFSCWDFFSLKNTSQMQIAEGSWRLEGLCCWGWSAPYGSLFPLLDRHCSASHPVWRLCFRLWQSMDYVFSTTALWAVFSWEKAFNIRHPQNWLKPSKKTANMGIQKVQKMPVHSLWHYKNLVKFANLI